MDEDFVVAKNGAVRSRKTGRIVSAGNNTTLITTDTAADYLRKRRERAQQAAIEAANEAVERQEWRTKYGDLAFNAAIVHTAMIKAQTPDDPKMVDAGRFVRQATGLEVDRSQPAEQPQQPLLLVLLGKLMQARDGDVVDAEAE